MQLEIVSYDGDASISNPALFHAGFPRGTLFRLVKARGKGGQRIGDFPLWALKQLKGGTLTVQIQPQGTLHSQRDTLAELFDVYDTGGPKRLIVQDIADGDRQWYVDCDPVDFKPGPPDATPSSYIIILFAPDPVWREVVEQIVNWPITATGQTQNITARGNRPAPIELRITPTADKSNDWDFEHLVDVRNRNQWELNQYPVDLTAGGWATNAIIGAAEMQADGDDLRVYVDGKEVDRWIADINTANTKVWINLDMRPGGRVISSAAFNIGTLTLTYSKGSKIGRFKRLDGCFRIDNEMVAYEAWDRKARQFTGCTRGIRGTTEANHGAVTLVYWVEHHIKIVYGDSTVAAPPQNDDFEPAFNISTSTNGEWRHDLFGDEDRKRSGRWMHRAAGKLQRNQSVDYYTGNQGAMADPWTEMGLRIRKINPVDPGDYWDQWYWRGQVAITNTRFAGEHQEDHANDVIRMILRDKPPEEKWGLMWQEDLSGSVGAFAAWPSSPITQAPRAGTVHLRLKIKRVTEGDRRGSCYTEVNDTRLTFSGAQIPDVDGPTTWARIVNPYEMNARITNTTTGEYLEFDFGMDTAQMLWVRSEFHDIEYRGQNQYQALADASNWAEWLMAVPGVNVLQITEPGVAGVTISIRWRGRNS